MRTRLLALLTVPLAACITGRPAPMPVEREAAPAWERIGASREGRTLEALTLGAGGRRVWILGGIHGDERTGGENLGRIEEFLRGFAPAAGVRVRLVRDGNPDGTAHGTRGNSAGVDLNRNWPTADHRAGRNAGPAPLSEPEVAALHADLVRFAPQVALVLHASPRGPFVNFDGPAASEAERFARAAATLDPRWSVIAEMGYPTPGSFGTWMGYEGAVPTLTIELRRGEDPLGAWPALRAGLAELLEGAPVP